MGRVTLRGLAVAPLLVASVASAAPTGEGTAGVALYTQPAPGAALVVISPSVSADVAPTKWLTLDLHWLADVVTGATPRTYGPADVVSAATSFYETRNVIGAGAEFTVGPAAIDVGYTYGIESDYRSHLLRAGLKLDLFHHNTVLALDYSHSFDTICDLAQAGVPLLSRRPLDSSRACFTDNAQLTTESLGIDTLEASWVQTLSRKWIASLVGSYQHLSGFQSNPYRSVRLSSGQFLAQESHPMVRDRGSITARVRYAIERTRGSLGFDLRLYRDTWAVQALTAEASYEQPLRRAGNWRFGVHARGYVQSGAFFFRDASAADSYDRAGPVGQFWTADQALAPLADVTAGGRFMWTSPARERRYWRAFRELHATLSLDYTKIIALTPDPPNALRAHYWIGSLLAGVTATGKF
jgi:hypothetical protein